MITSALLAAAVSTSSTTTTTTPTSNASHTSHTSIIGPLVDTWFLLPGAYYVQEVGNPEHRPTSSGAGFELSAARHLGGEGEWIVGALAQAEKMNRWRGAAGVEVGYELFGVELCAARDFSGSSTGAQWSMQIAPYVSSGFLWVSARWVIAIDKSDATSPGQEAMILVGLKIPIPFAARGAT